jgi:hypothetical protein
MDDDKKKTAEIEIAGLLILIFIVAIFPTIYSSVTAKTDPFGIFFNAYWPHVVSIASSIIGVLIAISFPLAIFFIVGIIYAVEKLKAIRHKEAQLYDVKVEPAYEDVPGDPALANRWQSVMAHISSANPNDWKQAIIDSDIMLDDILTKMGYRGESVGEKLKRVEPGDFRSIRDAWDAHMVRNAIAHQGSDFILNEHDARQTVNRYKKVFEEFFYI